jgi:small-conductance mechanosensitive channel
MQSAPVQAERLLGSMLADFWADLHDPSVIWQVAALTLSLALAWWLSRAAMRRLRRRPRPEDTAAQSSRAGLPILRTEAAQLALARVLFPLYGLVLVAIVRTVMRQWQSTNLLRLAVALMIASALARTIIHVVSRLTQTPALVAFERAVVVLAWGGVALYVTGLYVEVVALLDSVSLHIGRQSVSLWALVSGGFWVMMTVLLTFWLGSLLEGRVLAAEALDPSLRAVLARVLRAALLTAGLLVGMTLVGLDVTALSVFGGALGVGLGLGLQRVASNYISGFIVLLERIVRIGDVVRVEQFSGEVREIRTRFTVLRSLDGVEHMVPNEMLATLAVQNFSRTGALRLRLPFQVVYGSDLDVVWQLAEQAARTTARVLGDPPPLVLLTQFSADGLSLELNFWIGDPHLGQANVISDVARALWERFAAAGISVPFPQREVRIVSGGVPSDGTSLPLPPHGGAPLRRDR